MEEPLSGIGQRYASSAFLRVAGGVAVALPIGGEPKRSTNSRNNRSSSLDGSGASANRIQRAPTLTARASRRAPPPETKARSVSWGPLLAYITIALRPDK